MNQMTKPMRTLVILIALVAIVTVLLLLTSCGSYSTTSGTAGGGGTVSQTDANGIEETQVHLSDGSTITCVKWAQWDYMHDAMKSGIDCNWGESGG